MPIFMEIILESVGAHAALAAGMAMIAIRILFMVADVMTRGAPPVFPPLVPVSAC